MKTKMLSIGLFSLLFSFTLMSHSCSEASANGESKDTTVSEATTPTDATAQTPTADELTNPSATPKGVKVKMKTNFGDVMLLLYDDTPIHRDNFVKLVGSKFYDGLLFHRIIKDFMIQGGDPESKGAPATKQLGNGGPGYTLKAEIMPTKFIHKKGALSAARLGDQMNPGKESSGSQFYIVTGKITPRAQLLQQLTQVNAQAENACIDGYLKSPEGAPYMAKIQEFQKMYQQDNTKMTEAQNGINAIANEIKPKALKNFKPFSYTEEQIKTYETIGGTPFLDGGYTVFGEVLEGLDIVEKMGIVATNPGDRPKEDVKIITMELVK
jgi:peptidyl-prolyl cis-trans isomerase B (cyclophilin B)